jgi:hypothetical protein
MYRRAHRPLIVLLALALAVAAALATTAYAGKPSRPSSYSPTLTVSWPAASSTINGSTNYLVSGCGYNGSYGGVNVVVHTPSAVQVAGQPVDANGCISITNFWTQGSGHYQVDAYQTIGRKDVLVASTNFDY